jgi:hypothetical protein
MALVLLHRRFPGPPWGVMLFVSVWIVCVLMFYHGLWLRDARWLVGAFLVGFAVTAGWWQCVGVGRDPATMADLQFAREIRAGVEQSRFQPLMFKATIGLDFFRLQFNLPPSAQLLHNLSYLRDRSIQTPVVYVITRAEDAGKLSELGCAEQLMQSQRPYDRQNDQRRLTLFRLTLRPDLDRYPLPPGVGVMQAMERRAGPWCGPAL